MALNFPNSPTDGQIWTDPNGQSWVYETTTNSWTAQGAVSGGMVYKGGIDITAAPPAAQSGWTYAVTTGGTPNAGFTGLSGTLTAGTQVTFDGTKWQQSGSSGPWTRAGTILSPANAGDDVNIGGANISLKADCSGHFSFNGSSTGGLQWYPGSSAFPPQLAVHSTPSLGQSQSNSVFNVTNNDTSNQTYAIYPDGTVGIGGAASSPNISLKGDGSATFGGTVKASSVLVGTGALGINRGVDDNSAALFVQNSKGIVVSLNCDGGAKFAGAVEYGGYLTSDGTKQTLASDAGIYLRKAGTTDWYAKILNDGSAQFAGDVKIGGTLPATPNITLNANGLISTVGQVRGGTNAYANPANTDPYGGQFTSNGDSTGANATVFVRNYNSAGRLFFGANSGGSEVYRVENDGTIKLYGNAPAYNNTITLNADGSATFTGAVTATVTPPSDARFKGNITPANPQLADVVALGKQLKNFDWNDEAPLNEELRAVRQLGLIAQEAERVSPGIVKTIKRTKRGKELTPETVIPAVYKDVVDPQDEENFLQELVTPEQIIPATYEEVDDSFKGISHDALIMKLLGAVAKLSAEVEALKAAK